MIPAAARMAAAAETLPARTVVKPGALLSPFFIFTFAQ
jgi:hypothetical protein